jgi:hypothetical protein
VSACILGDIVFPVHLEHGIAFAVDLSADWGIGGNARRIAEFDEFALVGCHARGSCVVRNANKYPCFRTYYELGESVASLRCGGKDSDAVDAIQ